MPRIVIVLLLYSRHKPTFLYNSYFLRKDDRLCGLVVRVSGYVSRGLGFDSRRCQIFWEAVGLKQGSLSLVRIFEELFRWKSSCSGLQYRDYRPWVFIALTTRHQLRTKIGINSPTSGRGTAGGVRSWTGSYGVCYCLFSCPTIRHLLRI
jgi:hypothetical protein